MRLLSNGKLLINRTNEDGKSNKLSSKSSGHGINPHGTYRIILNWKSKWY